MPSQQELKELSIVLTRELTPSSNNKVAKMRTTNGVWQCKRKASDDQRFGKSKRPHLEVTSTEAANQDQTDIEELTQPQPPKEQQGGRPVKPPRATAFDHLNCQLKQEPANTFQFKLPTTTATAATVPSVFADQHTKVCSYSMELLESLQEARQTKTYPPAVIDRAEDDIVRAMNWEDMNNPALERIRNRRSQSNNEVKRLLIQNGTASKSEQMDGDNGIQNLVSKNTTQTRARHCATVQNPSSPVTNPIPLVDLENWTGPTPIHTSTPAQTLKSISPLNSPLDSSTPKPTSLQRPVVGTPEQTSTPMATAQPLDLTTSPWLPSRQKQQATATVTSSEDTSNPWADGMSPVTNVIPNTFPPLSLTEQDSVRAEPQQPSSIQFLSIATEDTMDPATIAKVNRHSLRSQPDLVTNKDRIAFKTTAGIQVLTKDNFQQGNRFQNMDKPSPARRAQFDAITTDGDIDHSLRTRKMYAVPTEATRSDISITTMPLTLGFNDIVIIGANKNRGLFFSKLKKTLCIN